MKILIDNGHGENTPGKRSPDGKFREYSYAREIARRIVDTLQGMGYDADLLVPETTDISLVERVRRANAACTKHGTPNVVLVSIHCNAAGNGSQWMKATGWEAFTSIGNTKADLLAELLYQEAGKQFVSKSLRTDYTDGDADKEEGFYILRKSKCSAVLTENFFQDNKEDVAYLESEEGKETIVKVHVDALVKYINMR